MEYRYNYKAIKLAIFTRKFVCKGKCIMYNYEYLLTDYKMPILFTTTRCRISFCPRFKLVDTTKQIKMLMILTILIARFVWKNELNYDHNKCIIMSQSLLGTKYKQIHMTSFSN